MQRRQHVCRAMLCYIYSSQPFLSPVCENGIRLAQFIVHQLHDIGEILFSCVLQPSISFKVMLVFVQARWESQKSKLDEGMSPV